MSRHGWLLAAAGFGAGLVLLAAAPMPPLAFATDKALHILAFAPFAWLMRRAGVSFGKTLVVGLCAAAGIELLQWICTVDRSASVVDGLASFVGAILGAGAAGQRPERLLSFSARIVAAAIIFQVSYDFGRPAAVEALTARAFERAITSGRPETPWLGAQVRIAYAMSLPNRTIHIADTATDRALGVAPGRLAESAAPGQGFAIFSGHRNRAFRALADLSVGDALTVTDFQRHVWRYRVSSRSVVRWNRSGLRLQEPGEGLALVTCWPVEGKQRSEWRLIVRAAPIDAIAGFRQSGRSDSGG